MDARRTLVFGIVAVCLVSTGCLHGPSPQQVRDSLVESADDVESYNYEGETKFEIDGGPGYTTRTTTVSTDAAIDRESRALRAEITSTRETSNGTVNVETITYLVNGSVYDRTLQGNESTGWIRYDAPADVRREWTSRDELGFYAQMLRNVSLVETSGDIEDGHVFRIELDQEDRVKLLKSKFSDRSEFFSDLEVEEFEMKAWVTEDHRLDRVETEMSITTVQENDTPTILYIDVSFTDDFSGYNESVDIELPEEARDAQPVGGLR